MIKWDDAYSVGIPSIDEQHKKLFQYFADLEAAVKEQDINKALFLHILDYLEDYAKLHFGDEESCMHRFKCPIAQTNQIAHCRFIEAYGYFRKLLEKEGATHQLFNALLTWAGEWLVDHICKIDLQLRPLVKKSEAANKSKT